MRLAYEMLQHLLCDREIGDNTVLQRANRCDMARCAAQHVLGLCADGLYDTATAARILANRHHGWFVEYVAMPP